MKKNIISIIFCTIIGITSIVVHKSYFTTLEICIYISLIIIILFLEKYKPINTTKIVLGKKYLYACFFICVIEYSIIKILYILNINTTNLINIISLQMIILSFLFITFRIFKIKLNNFNFNISIKTLFFSTLIGLIFVFITLGHTDFKGPPNLLKTSFEFIDLFLFTSFHEETVYRGLLISGLKTYNIQKYSINIIQSIIFGITHFSQYGELSVFAILCTSSQVLAGFFLGELYIYTKSLMPGMIIHLFMDLIIY